MINAAHLDKKYVHNKKGLKVMFTILMTAIYWYSKFIQPKPKIFAIL